MKSKQTPDVLKRFRTNKKKCISVEVGRVASLPKIASVFFLWTSKRTSKQIILKKNDCFLWRSTIWKRARPGIVRAHEFNFWSQTKWKFHQNSFFFCFSSSNSQSKTQIEWEQLTHWTIIFTKKKKTMFCSKAKQKRSCICHDTNIFCLILI